MMVAIWLFLVLAVLAGKQVTFASATPASDDQVEEVLVPDEESKEDVSSGEADVPAMGQKRDLANQLSDLDLDDSGAMEMADSEADKEGAIAKRSRRGVDTVAGLFTLALHSSQLSSTVNFLSGVGYRPHFIDAYTVGSSTYFNVIFRRKVSGEGWRWYYGLTGSRYQSIIDSNVGSGYRLKNVEAYINTAGNIRYCAIFIRPVGSAPASYAYHGQSTSYHFSKASQLISQGYHMVNQVLVQYRGTTYVTALYERSNVGSWWYYSSLTPSQFNSRLSTQRSQGRELCHVSVYRHSGSTRYSAIFYQNGPSSYYYWSGVSSATILDKHSQYTSSGYDIQLISGYPETSPHCFVGFWAK